MGEGLAVAGAFGQHLGPPRREMAQSARARRHSLGEPVRGVVVDAEIEVEAGIRDRVRLLRREVDDLDQSGQRPADVDAGGVRPETIVEDQPDAVDAHGCRAASARMRKAPTRRPPRPVESRKELGTRSDPEVSRRPEV
jgi:hypothetical protein